MKAFLSEVLAAVKEGPALFFAPVAGAVEALRAEDLHEESRMSTIKTILAEGEWLTAEQLNALQPDPPAQKSQPASNWKRDGRIYSVNHGGREYFARYQFDEAYQPLPVIQDVLQAFGYIADTWEIAAWFAFPNGWISKPGTAGQEPMTPQDALDRREALLNAAAQRHGSYVA